MMLKLLSIQPRPMSIRRMWLISVTLLLMETLPTISSQGPETPHIVKFENNNNGNGQYSFEFETSDGTYRLEEGGAGGAAGALRVRGVYRYRAADGRRYSVRYAADENGYRASVTDSLASPHQVLSRMAGEAICSYQSLELQRLFPYEFPVDNSPHYGSNVTQHEELRLYFFEPGSVLSSHFHELVCRNEHRKKVCALDGRRLASERRSVAATTRRRHVARARLYCVFLICFTDDELDRVVAAF